LVVYRPINGNVFLGIIDDVYFDYHETSGGYKKKLKLRNLLYLDKKTSKVSPVRDAPPLGSAVHFADEADLNLFFPAKLFPDHGFIGTLRGTRYPLPIDIDKLCFANAAILAGIGHGKSHLASLIVAQYQVTGKKVLVIDPSAEWSSLMVEKRDALKKSCGIDLKISSFEATTIPFLDQIPMSLGPNPPTWIADMWKAFAANNITVLDVSLSNRGDLTAEQKLANRCKIAYYVQQQLMRVALNTYGKTKKPYSTPTCIVLEEAHEFVPSEFVPSKQTRKYQEWLCALFSISTKEYRKYGSGHLFIDQSLKAIHEGLQIQTFLLGTTTQPSDLRYVQERLGSEVASAAQRTTGGVKSSWAVLGVATPMVNLAWEIESYTGGEVNFLAKSKSEPGGQTTP
jgi:DNA helicase HerA-like ATPase